MERRTFAALLIGLIATPFGVVSAAPPPAMPPEAEGPTPVHHRRWHRGGRGRHLGWSRGRGKRRGWMKPRKMKMRKMKRM